MNTFFSDKIILWRKMTKIWLKIWLKVKENGTKKFKLAKMVAKEKKILVRTLPSWENREKFAASREKCFLTEDT